MKDAISEQPAMTDEQYQAEAESLLAQMRLLREQIKRDDEIIEQYKRQTRATLDHIDEMLNRREARSR